MQADSQSRPTIKERSQENRGQRLKKRAALPDRKAVPLFG